MGDTFGIVGNTFLPQFFVSHGDTKDTKTHEGIKMNNILCVLRVPIAIGIVGNTFGIVGNTFWDTKELK